jgi:hypothetical protein
MIAAFSSADPARASEHLDAPDRLRHMFML